MQQICCDIYFPLLPLLLFKWRSNHVGKYWILTSTELCPIIQRGACQWWYRKEKNWSKTKEKAEKGEPELEFLLHEQRAFGFTLRYWWLIKHHLIDCNFLNFLPVRIFNSNRIRQCTLQKELTHIDIFTHKIWAF